MWPIGERQTSYKSKYEKSNLETPDCDLFPEVTDFRKRLPCNFIFAHININSFRHKFTCVSDISTKKQVDYLAISETKLDYSFPKSQFGLGDYVLYRQDLKSSSGGLIVYIRDDLTHRRLFNSEINEYGFESLCIVFLKCMSRITDSILISHEDFAFIGDMNCCPSKSDTIQNICDLYDLNNLIKDPTCFKGSNPSILDVILVTNPRRYISTLNVRCYLSDFHNIIGAATKRFTP